MTSIKQALSALALACTAATAVASPVEVVFDVTATSRTLHEWFDNEHHYMTDPDFVPLSFSIAFEFDADRQLSQNLFPGADATPAYAFTRFVGGTGTPLVTPLYDMLHGPTPEIATRHGGSDAVYGKDLQAVAASPDDIVAVKEHATFLSYEGWSMPDLSEPDAIMTYDHRQGIALQVAGTPLSASQLGLLSGQDLMAFLSAQIGVVQVGAFTESGGILSQRYVDGVPQGAAGLIADRGLTFKGDVKIRSVTVVPEPEGLALGLAGIAVLALRSHARRDKTSTVDKP